MSTSSRRQIRQVPAACDKTVLKTIEKVEEKTALEPARSSDGVERIGESRILADASRTEISLENENEKVGLSDHALSIGTDGIWSDCKHCST